MPFFGEVSKEPGSDWLVTVKYTTTYQVNVYGGDEARAREEAISSVMMHDDDVVEILKVEEFPDGGAPDAYSRT